MLLGKMMLESTDFARAQLFFDRVRLDGPFSNQALLSAGWADVSAQNYERAVVPWSILAKREVTDSAVQEALLALPYAYSKLNVHGRAAVLYGDALKSFGEELNKVDASIKSIADGRFLKALAREEIQQDKGWVIRLRTLPDAPETFYLMQLMASHDFQTALQNYLDLEELRKKMAGWQKSLDAYEDMIRLRRQNYEPLLPGIDAQFRELDAQIRLRMEQRNHLQQRLQQLLIEPRPDLLATADERIVLESIRGIEQQLHDANGADVPQLQQRVRRLKGTLTWTLYTSYPERLTEAHEHLNALNADVAVLTKQYQQFVRTRQAAAHSYMGYDDTISRLRTRAAEALQTVNQLMAKQGHLIETVAIDELKTRRARLEVYQTQARYAVADSYDRAAKAQGTPTSDRRCSAAGGGGADDALPPRTVRSSARRSSLRAPARRRRTRWRRCTTCAGSAGREGRRRPRHGDAQLPALPRRDAGDAAHAGSDASSGRSEDREGIRTERHRRAARAAGAASRRLARRERRGGDEARGEHRRRGCRLRAGARAARQRAAARRVRAGHAARTAAGRRRRTTSRAPVRSRRSSCTTACSRSIRPTSTTIRCCTRRRAPTTSSDAPSKR